MIGTTPRDSPLAGGCTLVDVTALLSIGEFATVTHLSVKTLRHYHETELLAPDQVDAHSGYRYYSTDQIPSAQIIRRFRDLDMPVRDIARLLSADVDERAALISDHLARLERRLAATTDAVRTLQRLLAPDPPRLQVSPPTRADTAGHRGHRRGRQRRDPELVRRGHGRDRRRHSHRRSPAGRTARRSVRQRAVHPRLRPRHRLPPDRRRRDTARVHPLELAARELALTVHHGPHDDIDVTYGALGTHLAEHALVVAGPVHETYLVGPRDTDERSAWRTEIGWPVFTTTPGTVATTAVGPCSTPACPEGRDQAQ